MPAPPGPVPAGETFAPIDLGFGGFINDLDGLSFGEAVGTGAVDLDFSVDAAPINGGTTVGGPVPPPCAAFVPNVTTEAAIFEAQGDIFTTAGTPPGCNVQAIDELGLGLIAPNPAAPGVPPLDNMDALAELPGMAGPCTLVGGTVPTTCPAFSVSAGSAVLPAIPIPACGGPVGGATILVPPGTPAIPPCLLAPCPPGLPCVAVSSIFLGLSPADDIDALCWFDADGDGLPGLPSYMPPGTGDVYVFSLTPASAAVVGPPFFSAADVLLATLTGPAVLSPAGALGLLPTDNIDGLICHDDDGDLDGVPNMADNCPTVPNLGQANVVHPATLAGDACDDPDADGVFDATDNCPDTSNPGQQNNVHPGTPAGDACEDFDGDGFVDAVDNCPSVINTDQANSDSDPLGNACDNCPSVPNAGQQNTDGDGFGDACDNDDDGDGYWDGDETLKGSGTLNSASKPEHCDGVDNDGDTVVDEAPALSGRAAPDPLCGAGVDADGDTILNAADPDDDDDGFSDIKEMSMSTDELDDCPAAAGHDAWPPDRDRDRDADIGDVIQAFGMGKIGNLVNYDARSDADGDHDLDIGDVIILYGMGKINTSCA